MGCVTVTYDAPLKKYLMCVTDGWPTCAKMNTYILEADEITGPWRLVTYMKDFGEQGYFLNIPSKFISADGRTVWLCYSGQLRRRLERREAGSIRRAATTAWCSRRSSSSDRVDRWDEDAVPPEAPKGL